MAIKTAPAIEPVIHEGVMEMLQRYDCVAEFWDRVALARECVPEMRSLEVRLLDDPDEQGNVWVKFEAFLARPQPWDERHAREKYYVQEAAKRFKSRFTPRFPLLVRVPEES